MFFVSNLPSSSQAGRHGFESRLPLQNQERTRTPTTNLTAITTLSSFTLLNHLRIQRPNRLQFLLQIGLSVDLQRNPQTVASLLGGHLGIDPAFMPQAGVCSTHHLERNPAKPNRCELRLQEPSLYIVAYQRRVDILGLETHASGRWSPRSVIQSDSNELVAGLNATSRARPVFVSFRQSCVNRSLRRWFQGRVYGLGVCGIEGSGCCQIFASRAVAVFEIPQWCGLPLLRFSTESAFRVSSGGFQRPVL
jgi:hypothetical protein